MRFIPAAITGSFQQIVGAASTALTVPAGAKTALVQVTGQNVRWRGDGTAPTATVGMLLYAGDPPTEFKETIVGDAAGLAALDFIEVAVAATINVVYLYD